MYSTNKTFLFIFCWPNCAYYAVVSIGMNVTVQKSTILFYCIEQVWKVPKIRELSQIVPLVPVMFMPALHLYQSGPCTKSCSLGKVTTFLSCSKKILVNNQSYRRSLLLGLLTAFLLCFHKQAFESMKNNKRLMRQQNRNISKTKIVLQILLTFCHSFPLMLLLRI